MANRQIENRQIRPRITTLVGLYRKVEKLKQELDKDTIKLRQTASHIFAKSDKAKDAASSVLFHGMKGVKIRVTRQAGFKRPTQEKRDYLLNLLGRLYLLLFEPVIKLKLKGGQETLDRLREECRKKRLDLDEFIEVEESFGAQDGFFDQLATLSPSLTKEQKDGLTTFMEANQKADRVSFLQTKSEGAKKHG